MQVDLSSDEKDSQSQASAGCSSAKKETSDLKLDRSPLNGRIPGKTQGFTEEAPLNTEYFERQIISLEPKDISDRALSSFERFLALVNSMYFG